MGRNVCDGSRFEVATGAQSGRTTEGANPLFDKGDVLRQVCVELPTGSAPLRVVLHVISDGNIVELEAKWVRGGLSHGGAGGLIWHGEFPLGHGPGLFIFARNDTGGMLKPTVHWLLEKRGPPA